MSTQMCRLAVLAMRSVCCHTHSCRPCVRGVFAPKGPSGPCVLMPQRRAYSLDALSSVPSRSPPGTPSQTPRAERTSPSSTPTQRNLSALQSRPLSRYELNLMTGEGNVPQVKSGKTVRHYIVDPALAQLVTQHLGPDLDNPKTTIFECNPGPGVLTRTLLNAGAQRLVALEGVKGYLPYLQELESRLDGQLEVIYCDYFKLDSICGGDMKPPAMTSDKLFTDLGISEANWTDDTLVKVVGILPQIKERATLLKMVYSLFQRVSVNRYGRIELFLFMSESEYLKMMARPGDMFQYRAFSVLCQMAWDIELLHKEPWESFVTSKKSLTLMRGKGTKLPNDHMCLVHLRPKADLFSSGLTPSNANTLLVMVKQCLAKRKARLIDKLNGWSPGVGSKLLSEMDMQQDILIGHVYPDEYCRLFELMEKCPEFKQSWLYEEVLENSEITEKGLSWL